MRKKAASHFFSYLTLYAVTAITCWISTGLVHAQTPAAPRWLVLSDTEVAALLPSWPTDHTPFGRSDVLAVRMIQEHRTSVQEAQAEADASLGPAAWAATVLGPVFNETRLPHTVRLLNAVQQDIRILVRQANAAHQFRPRPRILAGVRPSLRSEQALEMPHSSYPSARTLSASVWAETLALLYPAQAETLRSAARRTAWLRVIGGAHFPSDVEAAQQLAQAVWPRLRNSRQFAAALDKAKAEVYAASASQP
jgi:acid phosphatase (class A)